LFSVRCAYSCSEVGFPGRRAKRAGDYGRSVVLLALSVVGLVEGVPFGFGWFLVALAITLCAVKKIAPRMLGQER